MKTKAIKIGLLLMSFLTLSFLMFKPVYGTGSSLEVEETVGEFLVNNYTALGQHYPSACALSEDVFVVAWQSTDQDGMDEGIFTTVINATTGKNITREIQVNEYIGNAQEHPSVCALSNDSFAIAWMSEWQDGDWSAVYARVFNATTGENMTREFQLNAYWTSHQSYPSICGLSEDTFAAAWQSDGQDGSGYGVFVNVFNATMGENITKEFQANAYTLSFQGQASISALSEDIVAIAWQSEPQDGSGLGVYARVFNTTTGENITKEFRVNHNTTLDQAGVSICALSHDTFGATWGSDGQDGSGQGIYARVFNATTGENITREFRVNHYTTLNQLYPSICALSETTIAITWQSWNQDGSVDGVFSRVFDATTGENITAEFQVNEHTNMGQYYPSICALSEESFAVAWAGEGPIDSAGIHARIFKLNDITPPSVSVGTPSDGSSFDNTANIEVNATITDRFSTIEHVGASINATQPFNITMDLIAENWTCSWDNASDYDIGDYRITVWAIDGAGNINDTESVVITLNDAINPSVSIDEPSPGSSHDNDASIEINATITDQHGTIAQAKAMVNASQQFNITMELIAGTWTCSWDNVSEYDTGDYEITVWAIDDANQVNQSETVVISVSDATPPRVSIDMPSGGSSFDNTASIEINATITDRHGVPTNAKAMVNASQPFNITMDLIVGTWTCTWGNLSSYDAGDYEITVWAIDDAGIVNQTESVVITVNDVINPSVSIISPVADNYTTTSLLINASILDVGSSIIEAKAMINASTPLNISMTGAGQYWTCTWSNLGLYSNGYYEITIWAIDSHGNVNDTQSVVIYLDNPPPDDGGFDLLEFLTSPAGIAIIAGSAGGAGAAAGTAIYLKKRSHKSSKKEKERIEGLFD